MSERFIVVGKIGAPQGIRGEVKITSFTEQAEDIFDYSPWFARKKNQWIEVVTENTARQGKYLVVKLVGCDNRDAAQQWTNCDIAIKREQLPELSEGQYYWSDLEGLEVQSVAGAVFGKIDEVMETGANPVLVVAGEQRVLIPYLPHVVKEVNLAANKMIVDWDAD